VNDTVRIYFGVGGPNLISSFHIIGEMFDLVWAYGDLIDPPLHGVQTVPVVPGGAVVVQLGLQYPANYILVDHALTRAIDKGAVGILNVTGPEDATIFSPLP
jgi:nitrite reductase (NO-forming)